MKYLIRLTWAILLLIIYHILCILRFIWCFKWEKNYLFISNNNEYEVLLFGEKGEWKSFIHWALEIKIK